MASHDFSDALRFAQKLIQHKSLSGQEQESLAHTTNEYIEIDQMKKAYKGYGGIVSEFLKKA